MFINWGNVYKIKMVKKKSNSIRNTILIILAVIIILTVLFVVYTYLRKDVSLSSISCSSTNDITNGLNIGKNQDCINADPKHGGGAIGLYCINGECERCRGNQDCSELLPACVTSYINVMENGKVCDTNAECNDNNPATEDICRTNPDGIKRCFSGNPEKSCRPCENDGQCINSKWQQGKVCIPNNSCGCNPLTPESDCKEPTKYYCKPLAGNPSYGTCESRDNAACTDTPKDGFSYQCKINILGPGETCRGGGKNLGQLDCGRNYRCCEYEI